MAKTPQKNLNEWSKESLLDLLAYMETEMSSVEMAFKSLKVLQHVSIFPIVLNFPTCFSTLQTLPHIFDLVVKHANKTFAVSASDTLFL